MQARPAGRADAVENAMRGKSKALAAIGAALLLPAAARALINPNFTPIHLTEQSALILKLRLAEGQVGERASLKVVEALKGKAPKTVSVDLTAAPKGHPEAAREQLSGAGEALLFAGEYREGKLGLLHAGGKWLRLSGGAGGRWKLDVVDEHMEGTWAGGTDMLTRCVRYVLAGKGSATVPVKSGTGWRSVEKIGTVEGKLRGIARVDLDGDGRPCVHVAADGGDRLLRWAPGKKAFEDITAAVKLKAKSRAWAWADLDGDGRVDLASFDGKSLTVWGGGAGGFKASPAKGTFALPATCPPMATAPGGRGGRAALVVGGVVPPVMLTPTGGGAFKAAALPVGEKPTKAWGAPQAPLVADFNNDSFPDVLLPFETDGLLLAGKAGGGFAPGRSCGVGCTRGGGTAAVGDFDGDGSLDVLAAGADGIAVWQNLGNGRFDETLPVSGEIRYKGQPFASGCGVGDFNNDARQDVFVSYAMGMSLLYFNRGFRSFGEAPHLEMALQEAQGDQPGQELGCLADFNGDGAVDYVFVLPNGEVYCAINDLGGDGLGMRVRLKRGAAAAPVAVTVWGRQRCLGAFLVRPSAGGTIVGAEEVGARRLTWRFAGGPKQEKKVVVGDKIVDVEIAPAP